MREACGRLVLAAAPEDTSERTMHPRDEPMKSELTTPLLIQLNAPERAALNVARGKHTYPLSEAQFARLLIRDGLIGMGDLALPRSNRGKRAGS